MIKKILKILIYVVILLILVKCSKVALNTQETMSDSLESIPYEEFDYGDYSTIKLLYTESGEVVEMSLDVYLYGVVAAEMPATYDEEALKAQAIVARTYTIYKIMNGSNHENADICDSSACCQAWISKENRLARWEESTREANLLKIENAVNSTIGQVILYDGQPIDAFFHSNSGGSTEIAENVWGGSLPYLQSVETVGEDSYSSYSSEVELSKDELIQKMLDKYSSFEIDFDSEKPIEILEYTDSGRVKKIKIGNVEITGTDCRSIFGLKSAKFEVNIDGDYIKFSVTGYGHGVGLSQCGADALAKQGYTAEEIIKYYFKDVEISE